MCLHVIFILGHLSSCGLAIVVVIMTIFFFFLMLLASTIKPVTNTLHPKCLRRSYTDLETNLFLIHDDSVWQQNELDILENILVKYTQCDIELVILRTENSTFHEKRSVAKYKLKPSRIKRKTNQHLKPTVLKNKDEEKIDLNINVGAKKLLKAFLERRRHLNTTLHDTLSSTTNIPHLPNIGDIVIKFPRVTVKNMTESEFFDDTPLYNVWRKLNKKTLTFAARILRLWENGGISFEIPQIKNSENVTNYYNYESVQTNFSTNVTIANVSTKILWEDISSAEENKLLLNMINIGYTSFYNLPEGLVTVDEEGIHMETKTTCHAFFGEALIQLKHSDNISTVPEIIRNTLKTFCLRGAVDAEYCNSVKSK